MASQDHTERMMRFEANRKSTLLTYVLWFFLGFVGAHRFYLDNMISGFIMLVVGGLGILLTAVFIGYILLVPIAIWWVIDFFLIPFKVSAYNNDLVDRLA